MPYSARKTQHKTKPYAIVNKRTGKIVARSKTKQKAQASARIRNRSH